MRVECEVYNDQKFFAASAIYDIGATSAEITLPARIIIQLGLMPFGKSHRTLGSTNHCKTSLRFKPAVEVTLKFVRNDEVIEERTGLLVVNCHQDEYEQELAELTGSTSSTSSSGSISRSTVEEEVHSGAKKKAIRTQYRFDQPGTAENCEAVSCCSSSSSSS